MSNKSYGILDKEYWKYKGYEYPDNQHELIFPEPRDLFVLPLFAVGLLVVRKIFETFLVQPIIIKFGLKDAKRKIPEKNTILEALYRQSKFPDDDVVKEYAGETKRSELYIQNWLRRRRNIDRPLLTAKFTEAFWRGTFYTFAFIFGILTLWQTPWFWDTEKCWSRYPEQLWLSVYYYYMIEGGFYISLLFSIFKDVKRKDFNEQLIHHFTTISLIVLSYLGNVVSLGSLVLAVHDVSDIILEYAKCFIYAKRHTVGDHLFTLFAVVFIVSRLVVFPYMILYTTLVKSLPYRKPGNSFYYYFNALLLVLQGLHIFWAWIIIKMAVKMMADGKVKNDDRSDVEESSVDENGGNGIKKER